MRLPVLFLRQVSPKHEFYNKQESISHQFQNNQTDFAPTGQVMEQTTG